MNEVQAFYCNEIRVVDAAIGATKDSRLCSWLLELRQRLMAAAAMNDPGVLHVSRT
jgi:hypothetical protein